MRYSDWQLNRLRDALRAYHRYGRSHDGDYFNWNDVSAAIEESAGAAIPSERLRQFVEGINTKDGGRKYPVPQDAGLDAIVRFATDEDNDLISEAELKEHAPSWQAALRLLDYLAQSFDRARSVAPTTLEGTYQFRRVQDDTFVATELTLQRPSDEGLIQVGQSEEFYGADAAGAFAEWTPQQRQQARKSRVLYGGWAVFTPEDNVILFLKNERNGRNRYYFTLSSDLSYVPDQPVSRLVLLHHDYPLEAQERANDHAAVLAAIMTETGKNILVFERTA